MRSIIGSHTAYIYIYIYIYIYMQHRLCARVYIAIYMYMQGIYAYMEPCIYIGHIYIFSMFIFFSFMHFVCCICANGCK